LNEMLKQKRIYIVSSDNAENNGSYLRCAFSGERKGERTEGKGGGEREKEREREIERDA